MIALSMGLSIGLIAGGMAMLGAALIRKSGDDASSWAAPAAFALTIGTACLAFSLAAMRVSA